MNSESRWSNRTRTFTLALALLLLLSGFGSAMATETTVPEGTDRMFYAHVNGSVLPILASDNSSADAFLDFLRTGDITIEMHDYGSFEKVGPLGTTLPRNDEQITTEPGDVILYQGNQVTIYYDVNSWSFTRIGRVQGLSQAELREILGDGNAAVTFSLNRESITVGRFDFEKRTVLLNSGYEMPVIGLGTWTLDNDQAENSVYHALKCGVRLIDTARYYGNEVGVGRGLQKAIDEGVVTREEVFITSKIYGGNYERAGGIIDDALSDLGVDYIDLLLIHQPGSDDEGVYKAMEDAVRDGRLRSIGISNYYTLEAVDEVLHICREKRIRAVKLPVSAPFHCALMEPAKNRLEEVFENVDFRDAEVPVYMNVDGKNHTSAKEIKRCLLMQTVSRVQWIETVSNMASEHGNSFLELGPGKTLTGFVNKICPGAETANIENEETLENARRVFVNE